MNERQAKFAETLTTIASTATAAAAVVYEGKTYPRPSVLQDIDCLRGLLDRAELEAKEGWRP